MRQRMRDTYTGIDSHRSALADDDRVALDLRDLWMRVGERPDPHEQILHGGDDCSARRRETHRASRKRRAKGGTSIGGACVAQTGGAAAPRCRPAAPPPAARGAATTGPKRIGHHADEHLDPRRRPLLDEEARRLKPAALRAPPSPSASRSTAGPRAGPPTAPASLRCTSPGATALSATMSPARGDRSRARGIGRDRSRAGRCRSRPAASRSRRARASRRPRSSAAAMRLRRRKSSTAKSGTVRGCRRSHRRSGRAACRRPRGVLGEAEARHAPSAAARALRASRRRQRRQANGCPPRADRGGDGIGVGHQRRDVEDDERVDGAAGGERSMAAAKCSGVAAASRSNGLPVTAPAGGPARALADGGRRGRDHEPRRRARVGAEDPEAAAVADDADAQAAGGGGPVRSVATSNSSPSVSVRSRRPARRGRRPSTSDAASSARCASPRRAPALERPPLTAMIGLRRATRRRRARTCAGCRTTRGRADHVGAASCSQKARKSLPTGRPCRPPRRTTRCRGRSRAASITAMPSARSARGTRRRPAGGRRRERRVEPDVGSVLRTPRQFGPTRRMPAPRHSGQRALTLSAGGPGLGEAVRKHEQEDAVPRAFASHIENLSARIAITASSTVSTASSVSAADWPATIPPRRFTAYTGPVNSPANRLRNTAPPTEPGLSEAPMTAIEPGRSTCVTAATLARASCRS